VKVSQNAEYILWFYIELNRIGFSRATICNCAGLMFVCENSNIRPFHRHKPIICDNGWISAVELCRLKYSRIFCCDTHCPVLFVVSAHYWSMQWAHLDTEAVDCVPQTCMPSEQEDFSWTIMRMIGVIRVCRSTVSVLKIYFSWS
jgi:hypothetical protein